jgi:LmbE family N-acetylglucosaminyl deacetylase
VTSEQDAAKLGTILGVWAHPDDEAYLSAGIMAGAVDAGNRVVCVTATRGEAGSLDAERWPPDTLASVREAELDACLTVLGVREHIWLDYPDGGCADVPADEAVSRLVEIVEDVQPDTVLTFGPDGMTWHADHIAVSEWTSAALQLAGAYDARLCYATKTQEWADAFLAAIDADQVMMSDQLPPVTAPEDLAVHVVLAGADLDRKYKAMLCQPSQVESLLDAMGEQAYREFLADELFRLP